MSYRIIHDSVKLSTWVYKLKSTHAYSLFTVNKIKVEFNIPVLNEPIISLRSIGTFKFNAPERANQ